VTRQGIGCVAGALFAFATTSAAAQQRPSRVLSLIPSATDVIVALGEAARLVARTEYDLPVVRALPSVGGTVDPNVEAILASRPDLILVWDDSSAPGLARRLQRVGLRTETITMTTLSDLDGAITRIGELLGVRQSADALRRAIETGLDSVRRATETRAPLRVLYVVWPRPLITTGGGTFIDSLIAIAGGRNVFGNLKTPWPVISLEAVVRADPDVIVWPRHRTGMSPLEVPAMRGLRAAREGRVYALEGDVVGRPGPRIVDAAWQLARLLHPEVIR
jgi:ABC-type Fe3+-hydroxamate transport system substrate-binding protein